ncbi:class I SAM-dependent methyltransferase [Ralstonia pseudosolanacearum]|uniref:class I SAM-dependent methyltransferase n=1 Tax=Ralstonia pseudosolanacearum TaxID=1310165 RepID=UPI0011CDC56C|nr:class I SAM-dependent methyltransferase [Ralstonia pseudosolanacearum]
MGQAKERGTKDQRIAQARALRAELPAVRELASARSRYATQWEITSRHFFESGYYNWMANKVSGRKVVLEIGSGVGYSTLTLAQCGHSIVAIDENPNCLMATKERLEAHGFSVALHLRSDVQEAPGRTYEVHYGQVPGESSVDVLLIEGDMLNDQVLMQWLTQTRRFDAVVCWLLGTHRYRAAERHFGRYGAADQYGFRILVQNAVYEMADEVLRPRGILHVVDRGGFVENERLIEAIKDNHREQASVTALIVDDVDHIPYLEANAENAMPMHWSPPDNPIDGVDLSEQFPALISVTSSKPD